MRRRGAAAERAAAAAAVAAVAITVLLGPAGVSRADEPAPWVIEVSERLELLPGAVGTTRVVLRGRGRHAVGKSGLLIDLTPARGLSLRQRRYQRADAAEAEAAEPSFAIPVRADAAGSYTLELRLRFWVCTPRSCQPVDERRAVAVEVREPPPPPPPVVAPPPPAVVPPVGKPAGAKKAPAAAKQPATPGTKQPSAVPAP